jgi:hypothetical protein
MRRAWTSLALTALLALGACGKNDTAAADKKDEKESSPGVTITAEQSKSMGLATVPVQAASYRAQLSGFGVVTALDAIGQTDADVVTAQAAATQSAAAAERARALSTGADAAVSRETYEAAQSKASADQAALALATRKRDAAFGLNAPWRGATERAAIMARLQSGRTVLVRVTFPLGSFTAPRSLIISRLGQEGKSWTANTVWDAPADPSIPGHGVFALVDGSDLAQGERVTASLPVGTAQPGILVPADALILGESDAWVYLQTGDNTYLRTRIDMSRPMDKGYFVSQGIKSGEKVVTSGAGQLYAHEINPSTEAED